MLGSVTSKSSSDTGTPSARRSPSEFGEALFMESCYRPVAQLAQFKNRV
jgi:hypothetical protein